MFNLPRKTFRYFAVRGTQYRFDDARTVWKLYTRPDGTTTWSRVKRLDMQVRESLLNSQKEPSWLSIS